MKRVLFVAGTDTDIGKTYFSYLLAKDAVKKGKTLYIKPIQTGYPDYNDGDVVKKAGVDVRNIVNLKFPSSPHLASRKEGFDINFLDLIFEIKKIIHTTDYEYYIIEAAGGLLVPINEKYFMVDMIKKLGVGSVYLVTRPDLGTLNHTSLSINELLRSGVKKSQIIIVFNYFNKDILSDGEIVRDNFNYFKGNYKCLNIEYGNDSLEKSFL